MIFRKHIFLSKRGCDSQRNPEFFSHRHRHFSPRCQGNRPRCQCHRLALLAISAFWATGQRPHCFTRRLCSNNQFINFLRGVFISGILLHATLRSLLQVFQRPQRCPSRGVRNPQQPVTPPKKGVTSGREATGQLIRKDSRFDLAAFTSQKLSQTNKSVAQAGELTAAENQLFKDVMQASALELEDQIAGRDPRDTFVVEEPLTPFLDYCFLIYQTKALRSSDAWLLYTRSQSQCGTGRKQAARMWVREWQLCTNTDIRQVLDFLLSRFPEGLPPNSVDSQTLRKFCQMLWSSKCPIFDTFRAEASTFSSPAAESSVLVFPVAGFPGPPPSPDQWYQWAHGTDSAGAIGILSSGRILPTAKQTLHLKPPQSSW